MTREEVINILQNIDPQCQKDCPISRDDCAKQVNRCLVSDALEYASDFLSADVVEVVRCKDCKHWQTENKPNSKSDYRLCEYYRGYKAPDGFCDLGERRDNDE